MNKLIIFDLDGVLVDSRELHFEALNRALRSIDPKFEISKEEHLSVYDGLSTTKKLQLLSQNKQLPTESFSLVWQRKQSETRELLLDLRQDIDLISIFKHIKSKGLLIAVASNSIRESVKICLLKLGLMEYVDFYVSNEDVSNPKPFPEMYWKCMTACKSLPCNTAIVEDSHIGRKGASDSKAHLIAVENRQDLTMQKIEKAIDLVSVNDQPAIPWKSSKLNVLIPMAGAGSRFAAAGYSFPKPLIEVHGKPMIQVVVENLNIEANYIYLVSSEHYEKYSLQYLLNLITPGCKIICIDKMTEGSAVTALFAKSLIDNDNPLLIANSDQFVNWNSNECLYAFSADQIDAGILTFKSSHPKWSYAKLGEDGFVCEVAEKKPISENATVGIYYWKKGSDFVKYTEQMISKNIRTNGEFYICPAFNEAIADNKLIRIKEVSEMWGLGTPEDLDYFLQYHK